MHARRSSSIFVADIIQEFRVHEPLPRLMPVDAVGENRRCGDEFGLWIIGEYILPREVMLMCRATLKAKSASDGFGNARFSSFSLSNMSAIISRTWCK